MEEDVSSQAAALKPWGRRAQKQAVRSSSPSHHRRSSSLNRRQPSMDLHSASSLGRQLSSSSVGSPTVGSPGAERGLQAYLSRSSRDGDVPELISQVG